MDEETRLYYKSLGLQGDFDQTAYMNPTEIAMDLFARRMGIAEHYGEDPSGHWKDAGKLPWHTTFSNQSTYSDGTGGTWEDTFNADGMANNTFTPSVSMMSGIDINKLRAYFLGYEEGNTLNEINMY